MRVSFRVESWAYRLSWIFEDILQVRYTYPSYHENLDITRSGLSGISHYNEVLNSLEDNGTLHLYIEG